jgi:hypothetical protein
VTKPMLGDAASEQRRVDQQRAEGLCLRVLAAVG